MAKKKAKQKEEPIFDLSEVNPEVLAVLPEVEIKEEVIEETLTSEMIEPEKPIEVITEDELKDHPKFSKFKGEK